MENTPFFLFFKIYTENFTLPIPGRIRIEVPAIKNLSISGLLEMSKQLSTIPIPEGIDDIRPNPFSGSIVITYKPEKINIVEYLKNIASSTEMQKLMGG